MSSVNEAKIVIQKAKVDALEEKLLKAQDKLAKLMNESVEAANKE